MHHQPKTLDRFLLGVSYFIWVGSILYSSYCVIQESQRLRPDLEASLFSPSHAHMSSLGWSYRDSSDDEWLTFKRLFVRHYPWMILYIIMSITSGKIHSDLQLLAFPVYTMLFTLFVMNTTTLVVLLLYGLSVMVVTKVLKSCLKSSQSIIINGIVMLIPYVVFLSTLMTLHSDLGEVFKKIIFSHDDHLVLMFDVSVTWFSSKCLSYSIDSLREDKKSCTEDYLIGLCYLFYFASFLTGPVHLFHDFKKNVHENRTSRTFLNHRLTARQLMHVVIKGLKLVFYTLLLETLVHLIHTHALTLMTSSNVDGRPSTSIWSRMTGWTFCGLGYTLTCLFYLKYFILYGFSECLSYTNGISLPQPPQCVSHTCQSTSLWRNFDRGLYSWLIHYFYRPILSFDRNNLWTKDMSLPQLIFLKVKQIAGAFVSFSVVCLFHRGIDHIIVWCFINFASVVVERLINESDFLSKRIGLKSLISAPLFAIMIISNIFFLSNYHLGKAFVDRIFLHPSIDLFIPVMTVMFAGCYVSFHLEERTFSRRKKDQTRKGVVIFDDSKDDDQQHLL